MPSHVFRNCLRCFGLVESCSLACETSLERAGAYIHGVPIFVLVPIFVKSLSERKWVPIFIGCLLS